MAAGVIYSYSRSESLHQWNFGKPLSHVSHWLIRIGGTNRMIPVLHSSAVIELFSSDCFVSTSALILFITHGFF